MGEVLLQEEALFQNEQPIALRFISILLILLLSSLLFFFFFLFLLSLLLLLFMLFLVMTLTSFSLTQNHFLFRVSEATKYLGNRKIFGNVSFSCEKQSILFICGPSGCGKCFFFFFFFFFFPSILVPFLHLPPYSSSLSPFFLSLFFPFPPFLSLTLLPPFPLSFSSFPLSFSLLPPL